MKMKNCTTGLLIACLCLLSSCRNRDTVRPGNYQISGITKTPLADFKIIYDCVLPVFEFRKGGTLCVFPDFNFICHLLSFLGGRRGSKAFAV
jgi:hypothetical protein